MVFIPNEQQKNAIELGKKWFRKKNEQVFVIGGYAGTGKTTIAGKIIEACGLNVSDGAYVAFVGKAAMVLSMKGLPARTIHSLIYDCTDIPKRDENGDIMRVEGKIVYAKKFIKKESLPKYIKIIIVDEGSMVNDKLMEDLKSFNIPIIVLGDLHQLPPVFGESSLMKKPDIVLTEIMRQAEGNPIIHFATMARQKKWDAFKYGIYGNKVFIGRKNDIIKSHKLIRNSNAVICAYNKTREYLNKYIREEVYGLIPHNLAIGDKLICRENCWDIQLDDIFSLTNGTIGYVQDINYGESSKRKVTFDFRPEFSTDKCFEQVVLDWKYLDVLDYESRLDYISEFTKFEFGYAITAHLSQGSQYDNVLVWNEHFGRSDDLYSRWLYTACTRGIDKLIIAL